MAMKEDETTPRHENLDTFVGIFFIQSKDGPTIKEFSISQLHNVCNVINRIVGPNF